MRLPQDVRLRGKTGDVVPSAIQLDRTGSRLVIAFAPEAAPDSLFMAGAVDTAGLPAGGTWDLSLMLPDPLADTTVVIAEAGYIRDASGARIVASVRGSIRATCAAPFHLEPGNLELNWVSGPGAEEVTLGLERPLRAGTYTLSLDPQCVASGGSLLGLSRSFRVGVLVFPNPLGLGEALVLENAAPGSEVEILDVAGRVRASWRTTGDRDRRILDDLAPGLYFIRLQDVTSGEAATRKLVVLR